ncbi:sigma-70 family RNA polymerase sigma factor [Virgisporangium aurantiacum]|uniref:RNA polymerase sigma factor SigL n=1 Tax=Virgisporangium aurantiacum TaxID=175570 RepID=A0A8J3ZJ36_9ACTN|nr:sigma-70 family RNA polymerase sigma factor [Virgisporangium aurantiacum]GIJ62451.1 RNA polymerase sigma factor SigL [Virgisporangium aurantiacum]
MLTITCPTPADRLWQLHSRHRHALRDYLTKLLLGDVQLAEDLVQETFLRAWRHLREKVDIDPDAFRPWLYTVGRRLVVDHLRARRARPAELMVDDLSKLSVAADPIGEMLAVGALRDALADLRRDHLEVLIELHFRGHSPAQVAERLGIPVGTVKSRAFYAMRALRAKLDG